MVAAVIGETDELLRRADGLAGRGDHAGALRVLQTVLWAEPDHAYAHAALAHCLLMLRRIDGARAEARLALRLDPDEPMVHFSLAAIGIDTGALDLADAHLRKLLALDPDDASGHRLAATLAVRTGDLDRALRCLRRAIELTPYDALTLSFLGEVHRLRGEFELAQNCCSEALTADRSCDDARVLQGRLHLGRGETTAAIEHAHFVLRRQPDDADALELLAAAKSVARPLSGWWWRANAALIGAEDRTLMRGLLLVFVLIQVLAIFADEFGHDVVAAVIRRTWLVVCAFTWFSPLLFRRSLERELDASG